MNNNRQNSLMTAPERRAQIPAVGIPRSVFDRSHGHKTTLNSGYLVPFYRDEVLPGDTINLKAHTFARFATLLAPIMDNVWATTFFFFVPNRLLWTNWERFLGSQDNPSDSTSFTTPKVSPPIGGFAHAEGAGYAGGLFDYLGVQPDAPDTTNLYTVNAFYSRAYNLIWNTWFRDENLQNSATVDTDNGPDTAGDYVLRKRGKRHDYFTSALPWPQKGTALRVPMASPSVVADGALTVDFVTGTNRSLVGVAGGTINYGGAALPGTEAMSYDGGLSAIGGTINELRMAEAIQELLERDARGGTRYTELIRQHFGVVSDDARLQRPEYLGGGRQNINIAPIAQTSESGTTPQGNLAAQATFGGAHGGFVRSFTEHGVILGLISIDADLNYQSGLDKSFMRDTKYDYFWPSLQNIGEQPVMANEIFLDPSQAQQDTVFGYQERFADYKIGRNRISGQMRSTAANSYDLWHLAEDFVSTPVLNSTFIQADYPFQRAVAVNLTTAPEFLLDAHMQIRHSRPMSVFSIPGGRI